MLIHTDARKKLEQSINFGTMTMNLLTDETQMKVPHLMGMIHKHFQKIILNGINKKKIQREYILV